MNQVYLNYIADLEKDTLNLLKKGNIIFKSNDLTEGAYIQNIYLNEDTNGIETLQIIGKFITGYIGKRLYGILKL